MASATRSLSTAPERREEIIVAAERTFAARGLHGTPTIEIAKAAGISQAYLFRLFPTKTELFLAVVKRSHDRIYDTFVEAAAQARAAGDPDILHAMGCAYGGLLQDRTMLLNQLNAHAACDDPAIRAQVRACFARLVDLVERETGAESEAIGRFFATGMLLNVLAAMRTDEVGDEHWVGVLMKAPASDDPTGQEPSSPEPIGSVSTHDVAA